MRITVFTPTYNRAKTLPRLFESLEKQTFKDFEWLIVDDGSTDNTEELVAALMARQNAFNIVYKKTENGGKHRAINRGIRLASGELTFIVDSDDWLPETSLEDVDNVEKSIKDKSEFGGVCGLKCYESEGVVGGTFDGEQLDITTIERKKFGIVGDKAEVYYTELLKKYPFPEFDGEKFATESLVWNKIAYDGYKLRFFNKNIYLCEYQADGLSSSGNTLYARNPKQWGLYISQEYRFGAAGKKQTEIQIYLYYLYLKNKMTKQEMIENIGLGKSFFNRAINKQRIIDVFRWLLHGGRTIKKTVRE